MSKQSKGKPWHSKEGTVHHDNAKCTEGKKVVQRIDGQGGKPHCPECGKLNQVD